MRSNLQFLVFWCMLCAGASAGQRLADAVLQPEQKPEAKAAPVAQPEAPKAAEAPKLSKLELVSPNGSHRILIEATNTGAGIWLSGPKDSGSVAIYHGYHQGPTVGVYAPGKQANALSAAISAYDPNGSGMVQLFRNGEPPRWLTFRDLERMQDPERAAKHESDAKAEAKEPVPLRE